MSAVAKLMAVMGLNATQFRSEMANVSRSMDSSRAKMAGFNNQVKSLRVAFRGLAVVQGLKAFISAVDEVKKFTDDTGIELISAVQLDRMGKVSEFLKGVGIQMKALAAEGAFRLFGGGAPTAEERQTALEAGTSGQRETRDKLQGELTAAQNAARTPAQVLADEEKALGNLLQMQKTLNDHVSTKYEREANALEIQIQQLKVAGLQKKAHEDQLKLTIKQNQEYEEGQKPFRALKKAAQDEQKAKLDGLRDDAASLTEKVAKASGEFSPIAFRRSQTESVGGQIGGPARRDITGRSDKQVAELQKLNDQFATVKTEIERIAATVDGYLGSGQP